VVINRGVSVQTSKISCDKLVQTYVESQSLQEEGAIGPNEGRAGEGI
jgi:hypothetical protein